MNWEEIGFKAGLEIHQQVAGSRLFSGFPAQMAEDKEDFRIIRYLRPSAGETGELDEAASHEKLKNKRFIYLGYKGLTGLVETDDEPVIEISNSALETAVITAKLLNMKLQKKAYVMRKVVVDGSNTSGFQRTMIVASEGFINDVRIQRLCLEEDSAKIISRSDDEDVYNLSRLGIPLLEITTYPDIRTPEQLQKTAASIGLVLRSTKRILRGLGTIRQDVNISISKGARVEIKGVQDLRLLNVIAANEAYRQLALVDLANELSELSISDTINFTKQWSGKGWIKERIKQGDDIIGFYVKGSKGLFGRELYKNYRLGSEIAGYAKAWGFGGIIHSDEDPKKYGLDSWNKLVSNNDLLVLVVGKAKKISSLITHVIIPRIKYLTIGVPSEVRKALESGNSQYLRPMPGAARMYPETDLKPVIINSDVELPELLSEKIPRLAKEYGIPEDVVSIICKLDREHFLIQWGDKLPVGFIIELLVSKEKEIKRRYNLSVDISPILPELFNKISSGELSKSDVDQVVLEYARSGTVNFDDFKPLSEDQILSVVKACVANNKGAPVGVIIGEVRKQLGGRGDGKTIARLVNEELK